jgi:antitoxin ParD1/3/4
MSRSKNAPQSMTLNVRVTGPLRDFVAANVSEDGAYDNVSEYVRDLIRRDRERTEADRFARLKAELQAAFDAPESSYEVLDADAIIARNVRG